MTSRAVGRGGVEGVGRIRFQLRERPPQKPSPTAIRFPDAAPTPKPKKKRKAVQNHDYDRRAAQPATTPPEDIERIVRLYKSGLSATAVAQQLGISKTTTLRYLKESGVQVRRGKRQVDVEGIVEDYARGLSLRDVGARHGMSSTTARRHLVAAGVEIRSQGEWRKA